MRQVWMHAVTVRILVKETAPAGGDEDHVAGLASRTAAFQIGHRYLLAGLTLHRPAHRWPGKGLQRDGIDRLAIGDEVPESVDVSAGVDGEVDASHVQPPLLDLDAALDLDRRKDPLRVHAGSEGMSEVDQRHASTFARSIAAMERPVLTLTIASTRPGSSPSAAASASSSRAAAAQAS